MEITKSEELSNIWKDTLSTCHPMKNRPCTSSLIPLSVTHLFENHYITKTLTVF